MPLLFLTPDPSGVRELYLFAKKDNSSAEEIYTLAEQEIKEHIEWSKQYSYGQAFDIVPIFVASNSKEFKSFEAAHKYDCKINVLARHRGLLPKVAYKYKWNEQWYRTDGVNFNQIMEGAFKCMQISEKQRHNVSKLKKACPNMDEFVLDDIAQQLAENEMWISPPFDASMPIM